MRKLFPAFGERTRASDKPNIVRKTTEKAIVERAANFSVERIVRDIAELQLNLGKTLTELSAKLTAEATKLAEIQQAITIEDARLHEIHEIDTAVVSLKGLLEYQGERKGMFESEMDEKRQAFEGEMERQRQLWRKEQSDHEQTLKERDALLKKTREREEEEYQYQLVQRRRKEKELFLRSGRSRRGSCRIVRPFLLCRSKKLESCGEG